VTESITFVCSESVTERVNLVNQIGTNEIVTFGWYKITTEISNFGNTFILDKI
jgi:hypothetical protein